MLSIRNTHWVLSCTVMLCCRTMRADRYAELMAEARGRIVSSQDYVFNQDIEITLKKGQALRLDCPANEHQITGFVLYYHEMPIRDEMEDIIRADAMFEDGTASGGGSRIDSQRALRQAGYTRCLVITQWHVQGETIRVTFRASDDIEYNLDMYRRWTAQGLHFSKMYKTRDLVPAVVIPETERIAGFARLWSEVKYNFAFFDQVPEVDWDGILLEYIPKVQAAQTDVEYYDVLRRCLALLADDHTSVWGPSDEPHCEPPVRVRAMRNQAVVAQVYPAEQIGSERRRREVQAADLQIGDIVTHIDGRPVQQVLAETIYPYIAASTPQARDIRAYARLLCGPFGTSVMLDVIRLDGSRAEVTLTRGDYRFAQSPNEFQCKELGREIVYVNLPGFGSDQVVQEFDRAFGQIQTAKGLVLDVRRNGGGSTGHGYAILSRLVSKSVPGSHWRSRQHIAAYKAWGRDEQWHEGDHGTIEPHQSKHYAGAVVVLTGPETASAAEDFVVAFQTSGRGRVVGQRTCGSTGQPLRVDLPGGGAARICTKRDTYPDGREFVGIGVIPDVEVEPTREDIASQRDVVLEKGVEVLKQLIEPD